METFTWNVSLGTTKDARTRVLKNQYGDGYAQRIRDGINSVIRSWPVTVKASSIAMADEIDDFLANCAGAEAFLWTPPNGSEQIQVTCDSWHRSDRNSSSVITATFEQTFQP